MYPHLQRRKWLYTGYRPAQNGAALSVSTPSNAKDTTTTGGTITPVSQTKILSWSRFDPEENLLDGRLELTGITEEVQPSFTEIIEYLPTAIIARVEEGKDGEKVEDEEEKNLSITNWSCPEYVQDEEGRWPLEGTYEFKAELPEGYELAEGVDALVVCGTTGESSTLTDEEKQKGVATISSGNHGSSVSYAASLLGIENAKIIVPETTPKSKVDKIKYFGAEVMLMGKNYDEAHARGMAYIEEHGMTYIDAYYDDPKIYGGQGTIAIELLEQNPDLDTIVVPIGGGGLITGIAVAAKAIKPSIRIVGVQTEACPAMIKSYEDGVFYEEYPCEDSLCDSLIGGIGALSYAMAKDYVDDFIAVSEETIAKAVSFMAREEKYIVEAGSCTTVAAVMDYRERVGGRNIALVLSGGNIDGEVLYRLMAHTDYKVKL